MSLFLVSVLEDSHTRRREVCSRQRGLSSFNRPPPLQNAGMCGQRALTVCSTFRPVREGVL